MPITQATSNVVNLNKNTPINGIQFGKGTGSGGNNVVCGNGCGQSLTTGASNVSIGANANFRCTTGSSNVSIGTGTNFNNLQGQQNIAIGEYAMLGAVGVSLFNNIAIGTSALQNVTSGNFDGNVAIGANALSGWTNGDESVGLGTNAGFTGNWRNSALIGANTSVTGNNQVQLGNASTTTYAYGAVQNRSDIRDKTDVRDTELGLDFVKSLRPVDFKWDMRENYRPKEPSKLPLNATEEEKLEYTAAWEKWQEDVKLANITHDGSKKRNRFHHGLIAQEVKSVLDAKGIDFGGFQDHKIAGGDDVLSIGYEELIAPMLKAIQELSAKVAELESK
jgi:hypothetical protein